MIGNVAEARSLRFASMARDLTEGARAHGLAAPRFRSPPKLAGRSRTVTRHRDGSATVAVVVRGRPWLAVVADMVDGFALVNDDPGAVRDLMWAVVEGAEIPESRSERRQHHPSGLEVVPPAA